MINRSKIKSFAGSLLAVAILASCGADGENPGYVYAPQMYYSVPYEPLSQITDETQGEWLNSTADDRGEFYNSNPYNPYNMTMRVPPENTVKRTPMALLPYRLEKDTAGSTYNLDLASNILVNPLPETEALTAEGRILYSNFCAPCHGGAGKGDGAVGQVYKGIPDFSVGKYADLSEGHIFHVITHGQGRMWPYASQVAPEDRWKIVRYVQTLQKQ